jgi:hypothetical protein
VRVGCSHASLSAELSLSLSLSLSLALFHSQVRLHTRAVPLGSTVRVGCSHAGEGDRERSMRVCRSVGSTTGEGVSGEACTYDNNLRGAR